MASIYATLKNCSFLLAGIIIGWQGNRHFTEGLPKEPSVNSEAVHTQAKTVSLRRATPPATEKNTTTLRFPNDFTQSDSQVTHQQAKPAENSLFMTHLKHGEYRQAIDIYSDVAYFDETHNKAETNKLKQILLAELQKKLDQGLQEDFTTLADAYLADFYDDIDVLLLLSQFNESLNYTEEAARVYQLAFSYAKNHSEHKRINNMFSNFVTNTDATLSNQESWWELQNFYFLLEDSTLIQPQHHYRLAEVLLYNGDTHSAEEQLLKIINHQKLGPEAKELLASLDTNNPDSPSQTDIREQNAVDLMKHGAHYQIAITLDRRVDVSLLLDTGASLTTLSRTKFTAIQSQLNTEHLSSMMFNTANGVTRGEIYQVEELLIGSFPLKNIRVAVIDFEPGRGAHGLLGMNVLRHFKFQIDQDHHKLLLEKR